MVSAFDSNHASTINISNASYSALTPYHGYYNIITTCCLLCLYVYNVKYNYIGHNNYSTGRCTTYCYTMHLYFIIGYLCYTMYSPFCSIIKIVRAMCIIAVNIPYKCHWCNGCCRDTCRKIDKVSLLLTIESITYCCSFNPALFMV